LTSESSPRGTVTHGYDNGSRQTAMTVAGQPSVSYTYDDADRPIQITQGSAAVAFSYDAGNRRTSLTLPNGITTVYNYNASSQLTGISYQLGATTLGDLNYGYDIVGRRTSVGGSYARTNVPTPLASGTHNANNQLTQRGSTSFTYDANGNLANDGSKTYTWDARNHLVSLSGGVTASFQYDLVGRRATKSVGGFTTSFLYDGANTVQELSGSTPTANLLNAALDEVLTRTEASGTSHYLADVLGNTIALTNTAGAVQTQYSYEPFGQTTATGASNTNQRQFTGRESDETGLYFYRARYYNPTLQRFISEDPLEFGGGDTNLYAYVLNDPVLFRDPSGKLLIGALVGGVAGGIEGGIGAGLQHGSAGEIIGSIVIGAAFGAGLGLLDPTEGALTAGQLALLGGSAGIAGDVLGQAIGNLYRPRRCRSFNLGEAVGAGVAGV